MRKKKSASDHRRIALTCLLHLSSLSSLHWTTVSQWEMASCHEIRLTPPYALNAFNRPRPLPLTSTYAPHRFWCILNPRILLPRSWFGVRCSRALHGGLQPRGALHASRLPRSPAWALRFLGTKPGDRKPEWESLILLVLQARLLMSPTPLESSLGCHLFGRS